MNHLSYGAVFVLLLLQPIASSYKCRNKDGVEANRKDGGCETYWVCRDFVGVALKKCPDGGQIDFRDNHCKVNGEVWCQWQHQQMDASRGQLSSQMILPNEAPRRLDTIDNDYYYVTSNTNNGGDYVDYGTSNNGGKYDSVYDDIEQWTYVCRTEWGHEPNLNDQDCRSFWRCDHFKGSLIQCKFGYLYDYRAKACRQVRLVRCHEQRRTHITSQPKHKVELKANPDGSQTLIHHYHYENN